MRFLRLWVSIFECLKVKNLELPNSSAVVAIGFDEIPLTSGVDFKVPYSLAVKVSPFHVIFDLNKILITTRFR
jgi:hypothetical protein